MEKDMPNALRRLIRSDKSIRPELVDQAIDVLRGKTASGLVRRDTMDNVITRRQAAEILQVHVRTVDNYARRGRIQRVKVTDIRGIGFTRSSVERLMMKRKGMVV